MPDKSKAFYAVAGVGAIVWLSQRGSADTPDTPTAVEGQQNTLRITRKTNTFRQYSRPYTVKVSGGIRPVGNVEMESSDGIDASEASGYVTTGVDTYVFTGEIDEISLSEGLGAKVNGVSV